MMILKESCYHHHHPDWTVSHCTRGRRQSCCKDFPPDFCKEATRDWPSHLHNHLPEQNYHPYNHGYHFHLLKQHYHHINVVIIFTTMPSSTSEDKKRPPLDEPFCPFLAALAPLYFTPVSKWPAWSLRPCFSCSSSSIPTVGQSVTTTSEFGHKEWLLRQEAQMWYLSLATLV